MNACEEHSFCVDVSAYVETPDGDTLSGLELRLDGGGTRGILETDKLIGYECHCYNYWAQNLDGSLRENPPGSSNNIRIGWDGEITYGEAATCLDIDECALETDNCHPTRATCNNTEPDYTCECLPGYFGDGVVCVDVDECAED